MRLNQFSDLTVEEFRKTYLAESIAQPNAFQCTGPQYPKKDSFDKNFTTESSKFHRYQRNARLRRWRTRSMQVWLRLCHCCRR